jgi:hypothetical protein
MTTVGNQQPTLADVIEKLDQLFHTHVSVQTQDRTCTVILGKTAVTLAAVGFHFLSCPQNSL